MVEQMRDVELIDDVEGYYIDGQPYTWSDGDVVALPRPVAHNLVRQDRALYSGDVYEVDDEDFDDAIGESGEADDELDLTIDELRNYVADIDDPAELDELEAHENENKDRKTAYEVIDARRDDLDE